MKAISIAGVSDIYARSNSYYVRTKRIEHRLFHEYYLALRHFDYMLGEDREEEYWQLFLRRLKKYRFEASAAPVPFNHPVLVRPDTLGEVKPYLEHVDSIYPMYAYGARALFERYLALIESTDNPGLEALSELLQGRDQESTRLLLSEARLIRPVEETLAGQGAPWQVYVITPSQLRDGSCCERIVVFGPARWFNDSVFSAPRAREIILVQYGWIAGTWKPEAAFSGALKSRSRPPRVEDSDRPDDADGASFSPTELMPAINMWELARKFGDGGGGGVEEIEARLFLLEGGWAVFLDSAEQASVLTLDLDEGAVAQIRRMPTGQLEKGTFVLLRTEGGGDYIVPIADRIIGVASVRIRDLQQLWKARIRDHISRRGFQTVCAELRELGARRATPANLRRWVWERSIRTDDFEDFSALMKLAEMDQPAEEIWQVMDSLDRAHREAGRVIRQLLLKQVLNADLDDLVRTGRMDFQLGKAEGGRFSAFRIEGTGNDRVLITPYQEGHPFPTGE